jgi:hypothetical protein
VATPFRFDRGWDFAVTPEELWTTLEQTDRYTVWWPWLRELEIDGGGLRSGATARLVIQAPLPYQLRCTIHVDEAADARVLAARMQWTLDVQSPLLRPMATVARPALSWAHDRIVERGLDQFEERALQTRRMAED